MTRAIALFVLLTVPGVAQTLLSAQPTPANAQTGVSVNAQTGVSVLHDYIAALEHLHALLTARQFAEAKAEALRLKGAKIAWAGGTIFADDSLLDAVAATTRTDRQLLLRLETTIAEIRGSEARTSTPADPKLLRQVAKEQEVAHLVPGGEVTTKVNAEIPFLERIATAIEDMLRWIGEKIEKLLDWLLDLFPRRQPGLRGATAGMRGIVWVVVALIVLIVALLAWNVARRTRRATAVVEASEPFGSKRDEDPLSRGATEWERYAAQLAAAGRHREAIRAWYHAVLVTSYSAGVLHFRKGRTNWEYVATLAPSLAWRPEMIGLTRRFEREWYGADESSREALDECSASAKLILEALRNTAFQALRERGAA